MAPVLGKVLHLTERGLVAKCSAVPKLGATVLDKKKKRIGNIADIFGPVNSTYILIKLASGFPAEERKSLINSEIYMEEKHGGRKAK